MSGTLSYSFGNPSRIACFPLVPKQKDNYNTCLKLADTMLYDAKRFGRSQVVWQGQNGVQWREKP